MRDDTGAAIELGAQLATLKLTARAHEDRIQLLRNQAAEEERKARAKERQSRIEGIEKKLAERDAAGADLATAISKADAAFRKLMSVSRCKVYGIGRRVMCLHVCFHTTRSAPR